MCWRSISLCVWVWVFVFFFFFFFVGVSMCVYVCVSRPPRYIIKYLLLGHPPIKLKLDGEIEYIPTSPVLRKIHNDIRWLYSNFTNYIFF